MSTVSTAAVSVRRALVKRPWIYWLLVALASLGAAASMLDRVDRVDAARASWGRTRDVWVAVADHRPGDPITAERRAVPAAIVEGDVVDAGSDPEHDSDIDVAVAVARQHVDAGQIVYRSDVVARNGPQAMTPPGWLVVPILESPPSGAAVGDRARAVSDGVSISDDALVVGHHDDVTLLAVPAAVAPLLPAASDAGRVTLLLLP